METIINGVTMVGASQATLKPVSINADSIVQKDNSSESTELPESTAVASVGIVNGVNIDEGRSQEQRLQAATTKGIVFLEKLPEKTKEAITTFDSLMDKISTEEPEIALKDWDFSINENNEISIIHDGTLTDEEESWLQEELSSPKLVSEIAGLRDLMIEGVEAERGGENGYSTNLGRYDLNEENFSEIINIREYLSDNKGRLGQAELLNQLSKRAEDKYSNLTYEYIL